MNENNSPTPPDIDEYGRKPDLFTAGFCAGERHGHRHSGKLFFLGVVLGTVIGGVLLTIAGLV